MDNPFPNRVLLGSQLKENQVSVLRFVSYKENQQIQWQREFLRLVKTMLLGGPDEDLVGPLFGQQELSVCTLAENRPPVASWENIWDEKSGPCITG